MISWGSLWRFAKLQLSTCIPQSGRSVVADAAEFLGAAAAVEPFGQKRTNKMKTTYSLITAVSIISLAFACSPPEDDDDIINPGTATGGAAAGAGGGGTDPVGGTIFDGAGSWVDGTTNTKGIQGSFFVLEDSMKDGVLVVDTLQHTDLTPDEFDENTPKPCVTGRVAPVTATDGVTECGFNAGDAECDWGTWGGGIGFNLNETGEVDGAASVKSTWDATAAGVTGFTFDISDGGFSGTIRFKAKMEGSTEDFCAVVENGSNSVALADLKYHCWEASEAADGTLDVTKLVQLEWQLVTAAGTEYTVTDFCVNSVAYY
jgi:hypothetical protein